MSASTRKLSVVRTDAPVSTTRKVKASKHRRMNVQQRVSLGVGSVGISVLSLSVVHCTDSISLLTGSNMLLAGLLAIGIDAGMVMSEIAELITHGSKTAKHVQPWARAYMGISVVLSMLLNAYAFGRHSAPGMQWASYVIGIMIPAMVLILGRISGHLWMGSK